VVGGIEGDSSYFCCGSLVGEQMLQLARKNGWKPLGTSRDPVWSDFGDFKPDMTVKTTGRKCRLRMLPVSPTV
jgi:hypothetical protein